MVMVEDVDVVKPEALEALIKAGNQILPRTEIAIGTRPHVPTRFRRDDELVAVVPEIVVEDPGEIGLGAAVGGP